jgi:coproporphyrinogen III oxidase
VTTESLDTKKTTAADWFRDLRDQICAAFEAIETDYAAANLSEDSELCSRGKPAGKFVKTPWQRPEGGSGEMGMMKGRVFEKVGVNISTVHGEFSEQFRKEIPGAEADPRFWASGISLVAHMASPLVPAAHFNTRMITVGDGTRLWFGGGGDLNPMFENDADTADFHSAFKEACDALDKVARGTSTEASRASEPSASNAARSVGQQTNAEHPKDFYTAFKQWCDEYFFIPHRGVARGVGGIFYDYLGLNSFGSDRTPVTSGRFGKGGVTAEATARGMALAAEAPLNWEQGFAFTQDVGRAFAHIYPEIIRRHMFESWTQEQRHHQLVKRGRYAEYNLLYDRGTRFGLMTGGNAEAILMSLPPVAVWE